jgi:3-oxoacyl-[acyl-carrier-protein] synthase-3
MTCLAAIAYVLGELELPYHEAPGFTAVCREYAMPDMPALFGWGCYRRTYRALSDLAVESARMTLNKSGLSGNDVDALILCSANLQSDHALIYNSILRELGLTRTFPIGVTWTDCTMLLTGLMLAQALVQTQLDNILIVSANRIEDESFRFQPYALFSDGAASCIVTSETLRGGFEILGSQSMSRSESTKTEAEADDTVLYRNVHEALTHRLNLDTEGLEKVLPHNLFLPVLKIKEGRLGVATTQLFLDNVAKLGHCFSADSLINLHDYGAGRPSREPGPLMFTANAYGLRSQMVLRSAG